MPWISHNKVDKKIVAEGLKSALAKLVLKSETGERVKARHTEIFKFYDMDQFKDKKRLDLIEASYGISVELSNGQKIELRVTPIDLKQRRRGYKPLSDREPNFN